MVTKYKQVDLRKIKIINNGKNINQAYKKEQRRLKLKRIKNKIIRCGLLLGLVIVLAQIIAYVNPTVKTRIVTNTITIDNLQDKIEDLKQEVVSTIRTCESLGRTEEDALITFDPNPKHKSVSIPSIGEFQLKVETVKYYYKKLYDKDLTNKEAVLIALDSKQAEQLTKDIIFKGGNKANDWYNCSKKNNIDNKLEIINKLQK